MNERINKIIWNSSFKVDKAQAKDADPQRCILGAASSPCARPGPPARVPPTRWLVQREPPPPQPWTLTLRVPPNKAGAFLFLIVCQSVSICVQGRPVVWSPDFRIFAEETGAQCGEWAGPSSKGLGLPESS